MNEVTKLKYLSLLNDLESVKTELIEQSQIKVGDICTCKKTKFVVKKISITNTETGLQYCYFGVKILSNKTTYKRVTFIESEIQHIEKVGV